MNSGVALQEAHSIRELVARLIQEHLSYPLLIKALNVSPAGVRDMLDLNDHFVKLKDSLTEHMLSEEFEIYPELMRRGLFDEGTSTIMQQHHELTASLGKMELALRLGNLMEFTKALDELDSVLRLHQPAEEEKVFPQAL